MGASKRCSAPRKAEGMNMTSRERVLAAINHQQPDRIPIDFGATGQTGISVCAVKRLRD